MRKWRKYFFITLLLCCSIKLSAQWESPIAQYWEVKGYYNPSYAGIANSINTTAIYKYQGNGIKGASQRMLFTADMPFTLLNKRHGAGIIAYTQNIGTLRNSLLAAQYSFKQPIGSGMFNIGLQAGIYNLNYDAGSVNLTNNPDQTSFSNISLNTTKKQTVDISAGISWIAKKFYVGFSTLHINQPKFYVYNITSATKTTDYPLNNSLKTPAKYSSQSHTNNSSDSLKSHIPLSFNFTTGYNIPLFNSFVLQPMMLLSSNRMLTYTQTTIRIEYNNKHSCGISWISDYGYSIFSGTTIQDFSLGYAYIINKNDYGKDNKGRHELYLKYDFPLDYLKPRSQPHKSIRLL